MSNSALNFLGTGSCFNFARGNTSAYYKNRDMTRMVLIDCGETVTPHIIKHQLLDGVKQLDILITHSHPDHIGGLSTLIFYAAMIKGITPSINATAEQYYLSILPYLKITGSANQDLYTFTESNNLAHGEVLARIKVRHVGTMDSYMYVLNIDGVRHVYTGDMNDKSALATVIRTSPKDTVYFVECTHHDYPDNPHLHIDTLSYLFLNTDHNNVYCMHFPSEETVEIARKRGFQIAAGIFDDIRPSPQQTNKKG